MSARRGTIIAGVLRLRARATALWAVAICTVAAMYTAFYPSIGGAKMQTMMETMPADVITAMGFDSIATAAGYVSATVYSLLGAVLVLVCAIGLGSQLVAGQEEDGVLELELTGPVSRARVYGERLTVLWLVVLTLVVAVTATLLLMSAALDLGLTVVGLLAAGTGLLLFGGAFGSLAFAVGAATGRRAIGLGVAAAVAVTSYVLGYIGPLVGSRVMERVSPYEWYIGAEPLSSGFDGSGLGLLAAFGAVAVVAGWLPFRRRDLMV